MQLRKQYSVDFVSDGTDTLSFDLGNPPLGIDGTPSEISDVIYTQRTKVPAAPFIKSSTLDGTTVEVVWSGPLPDKDIELKLAVYTLIFVLTF